MTTDTTARVRGTEIDRAMLQSMATSLRSGMDFSFNRHDMAELLDRLAAIQPDPEPQQDHNAAAGKMVEPEPVAWRYRSIDKPTGWTNVTEKRRASYGRIGMEEQPLYATPSSAGTVSVEAAARVLLDSADDIWTADMSTATDKARAKAVKNGHKYRVIDREGWKAALRALAGE